MSIVTDPSVGPSATLRALDATVADSYRFVVGVDTHAAEHVYGLIGCPHGLALDLPQEFPTTQAGIDRAIRWLGRRTGGDITATLVVVEGTGSYGAILASRLADLGYRVVEAPTPARNRGQAKNDALDAAAVAQLALRIPTTRLRDRRGAGPDTATHEALQVLLTAREQDNDERTRAINALTALVRTHQLGIDARRALTRTQITQIAHWRPRSEHAGLATARTRAVRLAKQILLLAKDLAANQQQLHDLVTTRAPELLALPGVGPVTAAVVLTAWSHPGRVRNEAAFAAIAGTSPIEASSGNRHELRLNRGGDRRLNSAITTIAMTRMRCDERTRTYTQRRRTEGLTTRRIRRCLKRYITRELYRTLNTIHREPGA
ncbi:IS110 family transposase [Nocardioides sp. NPDC059952]|uniref:IS110 family transposase n=1 Tax=Nocardioides sp. NPDC059952 TaxID=3347014 RepID=UPI0036626A50